MSRRLVVGLGNPGAKYAQTRHNVGFLVVDRLVSKHPPLASRSRFEADVYEARVASESWLLLKPRTYMNLSGQSVAAALAWYALEPDQLLVVCDDFNLPLGRLRLRRDGSAGGQRGLEDIIRRIGHSGFPRLRVGIAAPRGGAIDHVLGSFAPHEKPIINEAIGRAAEAVELWAAEGLEAAMNSFNPALPAPESGDDIAPSSTGTNPPQTA